MSFCESLLMSSDSDTARMTDEYVILPYAESDHWPF